MERDETNEGDFQEGEELGPHLYWSPQRPRNCDPIIEQLLTRSKRSSTLQFTVSLEHLGSAQKEGIGIFQVQDLDSYLPTALPWHWAHLRTEDEFALLDRKGEPDGPWMVI